MTHFNNENIQAVYLVIAKKHFKLIADDEVTKAIQKFNDSITEYPDKELVKHCSKEVHTFTRDILNDVHENWQYLNRGSRTFAA